MNIITSGIPKYSNGEIHDAFMREIRNGFGMEKALEDKREMIARKEAAMTRGKRSKALGKCVATIPARDYFRILKKYGHQEVHSNEFIKFFQKKHPELSPNRL
jgi:hypothetical protein